MNEQQELKQLERLLRDAEANASEIIRVYYNMVKEKNYDSGVIHFLNQSAAQLLSPEVIAVLRNHRLDAFSYILVANNLLNLEDVQDDLQNDNVLTNNIPSISARKLKAVLSSGAAAFSEPPAQSSVQQQKTHQPTVAVNEETNEHQTVLNPVSVSHSLPKGTSRTKRTRLATDLLSNFDYMKLANEMKLYKLPLKQLIPAAIMRPILVSSSIIQRFSFGEPSLIPKASKTILLMGATGSGKTTMINAMINYVLGVEWEDLFRFLLIDEIVQGESQAFSQTRGVTAYDIHYRDGFRIPYSLTIIDTPGFGDTEGAHRDIEITSSIKQLFEDKCGIQVQGYYVDVIGLLYYRLWILNV